MAKERVGQGRGPEQGKHGAQRKESEHSRARSAAPSEGRQRPEHDDPRQKSSDLDPALLWRLHCGTTDLLEALRRVPEFTIPSHGGDAAWVQNLPSISARESKCDREWRPQVLEQVRVFEDCVKNLGGRSPVWDQDGTGIYCGTMCLPCLEDVASHVEKLAKWAQERLEAAGMPVPEADRKVSPFICPVLTTLERDLMRSLASLRKKHPRPQRDSFLAKEIITKAGRAPGPDNRKVLMELAGRGILRKPSKRKGFEEGPRWFDPDQ